MRGLLRVEKALKAGCILHRLRWEEVEAQQRGSPIRDRFWSEGRRANCRVNSRETTPRQLKLICFLILGAFEKLGLCIFENRIIILVIYAK